MEFPISQPKVVRLPRNEKQTYRLNSRPQMWPMVWIYQIVTGVTSVVGVPSTHLVGSDIVLVPIRRQAIIWSPWTNDGLVYWCIYASLGLNELTCWILAYLNENLDNFQVDFKYGWLRYWWHQAVTWTSVWPIISEVQWHSLKVISQEIPQSSITTVCLKITHLKFDSNLPGANELNCE